jgi:hypothetical protein
MNTVMVSRTALISSRLMRGLIVLYLLFDVVGHVLVPVPVADALTRVGS